MNSRNSKSKLSFYKVTICPYPSNDPAKCIFVSAFPMHFALFPLAIIHSSIRPLEYSIAFLHIIIIISGIAAPICPIKLAFAMHDSICPVPFICSLPRLAGSIHFPLTFAISLLQIMDKISNIYTSICPHKLSETVLLAVLIIAFVNSSVWPFFPTWAVWLVVTINSWEFDFSFIVNAGPETVRFVIFVLASMQIAIFMIEPTPSFSIIESPLSLIGTTLWIEEYSVAMAQMVQPSPKIDVSLLRFVRS